MKTRIEGENSMQKLKLLAILLCMLHMPVNVLAATPANAEPLEEVPPPPKIVDGEALEAEPQVTIRKKGKETVEEYSVNGQVYMMKVTPEHGVPYYLHKDDQDGGWVNTGPVEPLAIPKWVIFRF
jgi:Protein of unknown function (DUF2782)